RPHAPPHPRRHLRLALRAVARRVLPARSRPASRTRVRIALLRDDRDQRLVLFAAEPAELAALARRRPARFPVRRQGTALYHALAPAARHRNAAGELL